MSGAGKAASRVLDTPAACVFLHKGITAGCGPLLKNPSTFLGHKSGTRAEARVPSDVRALSAHASAPPGPLSSPWFLFPRRRRVPGSLSPCDPVVPLLLPAGAPFGSGYHLSNDTLRFRLRVAFLSNGGRHGRRCDLLRPCFPRINPWANDVRAPPRLRSSNSRVAVGARFNAY